MFGFRLSCFSFEFFAVIIHIMNNMMSEHQVVQYTVTVCIVLGVHDVCTLLCIRTVLYERIFKRDRRDTSATCIFVFVIPAHYCCIPTNQTKPNQTKPNQNENLIQICYRFAIARCRLRRLLFHVSSRSLVG
jgi:hypothetical protein